MCGAFLDRPMEGEWPYLWLDATYSRSREGGRIVSVAAIIAVAVSTDGRREIVGLRLGPSEAETFWSGFLKSLVRRGLKGVKLVISDAHEGLKQAIAKVLGATWQRCRVHWMRNALAHVPKGQHTMVAAAIRQAFLQPDQATAGRPGARWPTNSAPRWPKLATLMDESEHDVLAYMAFPAQHRTKLHTTNPLERLNKEVKRRADVVGIFPNEASIIRLIGAVLIEQNDEWQLQHRYMQLEAMAELAPPAAEPAAANSTQGRLTHGHLRPRSNFHLVDGRDRQRCSRNSGFGFTRIRAFREHFRTTLADVHRQYPGARFELDQRGMTRFPSLPPVHGRHMGLIKGG